MAQGSRQTFWALGPQQWTEPVATQKAPGPNDTQSALLSHCPHAAPVVAT
jgi:hypothetical protein